ncbi:carbamate kinase [Candidatus Micrarchaeota archaeon]|nr:carbamate kinase [Candidatus Micrarchaeota archaeon]
MRIIIALGGNALIKKGQKGTAEEQLKTAEEAVEALKEIIENNEIVITHGNGPQVGALLIQQNATNEVPAMPLDVQDAMTQGEIGYFIQRAIMRKTNRKSVTLVTRVVVDEEDPAFRNPTKPIGPFYSEKVRQGMIMDAGRGYRMVVASPQPIKVLERKAIMPLLQFGLVVVAGGGGGIPINSDGIGIEAVIDKDRCASLIAREVDAELLLIITAVPGVYRNFGKENQELLHKLSVKEAKKLMESGEFAEGSMKPKIEAAIDFIRHGGSKAIICGLENAEDAVKGKSGTIMVP